MMGFVFWCCLKRELRLVALARSEWVQPICFYTIIIALFAMSLGASPQYLQSIAPGVLWLGILLALLLSIESSLRQDMQDGSLEQMLLSPQPLWALMLAKGLAHWMIYALPLICLGPILGLWLQLSFNTVLIACISLLLGTPAVSFVAMIGVSLTLGLRQGGVLITLITLPLLVPILIFGASSIEMYMSGMFPNAQWALLGAMSILAICLAPFASGSAVRVSLG